jgi:hypothetical protein
MSESMLVDGAEFEISRHGTWIAVFDADTVVHIKKNPLGWQAWNVACSYPVVEPICFSKDLEDCAHMVVKHRNAMVSESKASCARRLAR